MGRSVAVVTDSTADIPPERTRKLDISVAPLTVRIDGLEYTDGVDLEPSAFYEKLHSARILPSTSQPSIGRFQELYESIEADEIVSVHISGKLSGTVNSARAAAEHVSGKRIRVIDSGMVSLSLGYQAQIATEAAEQGLGLEDVVAKVDEARGRTGFYALLETLEHARRSGRIGVAQALVGSMLQVKPIVTIRAGAIEPCDRPRTMRRGAERLAQLTLAEGPFAYLGVVHANNEALAQELAEWLSRDAPATVEVVCTGAVIGTHCGPGAVATCFLRAKR